LIDLQTFAEELFAKAQVIADRNWCLEATASGQLVGDRQRITQAIMNLVQNAAQHTTPENTITLGASRQKNTVHFWVQDNGPGIALKDQQYIFERFARASNDARRSEGAGLGLSIVKVIVTAHGGVVRLQSQPGQGSTFTLMFPLDPPIEVARYETKYPDCGG
jgi:signal transduction histidine kinase